MPLTSMFIYGVYSLLLGPKPWILTLEKNRYFFIVWLLNRSIHHDYIIVFSTSFPCSSTLEHSSMRHHYKKHTHQDVKPCVLGFRDACFSYKSWSKHRQNYDKYIFSQEMFRTSHERGKCAYINNGDRYIISCARPMCVSIAQATFHGHFNMVTRVPSGHLPYQYTTRPYR